MLRMQNSNLNRCRIDRQINKVFALRSNYASYSIGSCFMLKYLIANRLRLMHGARGEDISYRGEKSNLPLVALQTSVKSIQQ